MRTYNLAYATLTFGLQLHPCAVAANDMMSGPNCWFDDKVKMLYRIGNVVCWEGLRVNVIVPENREGAVPIGASGDRTQVNC